MTELRSRRRLYYLLYLQCSGGFPVRAYQATGAEVINAKIHTEGRNVGTSASNLQGNARFGSIKAALGATMETECLCSKYRITAILYIMRAMPMNMIVSLCLLKSESVILNTRKRATWKRKKYINIWAKMFID